MIRSPFIYGSTVSNESFTDRGVERKKLYNNLVQGINTTIISPRRWGKSSLVEKVFDEINQKETDIRVVLIDLFSVATEDEFLELFAKEIIKASSSKWEDWVNSAKDFFNLLIPRISIGPEPMTDLSISFDKKEIAKYKEEIINLPEVIATKKKLKFIIGLDEFQNLATFPQYESFEKNLRAIWQRQKRVTFCIFGSKRHMMTDIFNNSSKPFYRFGDIILLGKISNKEWSQYISQGFTNTGKVISYELANMIPSIMKNHSWYVQQLSHYVWQQTEKIVNKQGVLAALSELVYANTPLYQKEIEILSITQLNLLKAVVQCETKFTSVSVMEKYKLGTPRNVSKNKDVLIKIDMIDMVDGRFEFLDPVFELWFLNKFFYEDYSKLIGV